MALLIATAVVLGGCGSGGTSLDVDASEGLTVSGAKMSDDGVFTCNIKAEEAGEVTFDIPYSLTSTPQNNPNIIGGSATTEGTLTFRQDVEAGESLKISEELPTPAASNPDTVWGTVRVSMD